MQKRGVPLDAVGIQSHVKAAQPDTFGKGLADYIEAIHQMGLEVYLTEMDVNEDDISPTIPSNAMPSLRKLTPNISASLLAIRQ